MWLTWILTRLMAEDTDKEVHQQQLNNIMQPNTWGSDAQVIRLTSVNVQNEPFSSYTLILMMSQLGSWKFMMMSVWHAVVMLTLAAWQQAAAGWTASSLPAARFRKASFHTSSHSNWLLSPVGCWQSSCYNKNKERIEEAELSETWLDGVFTVLDWALIENEDNTHSRSGWFGKDPQTFTFCWRLLLRWKRENKLKKTIPSR